MSENCCRLCHNLVRPFFYSKILNKYDITYYYCDVCGVLQTEYPYWLEESYHESINITDTGIISRNLDCSRVAASLIYLFFNHEGEFLDYAGGYGIFTRLMRDIGFDFYWYDLYSKNLVARGFEYSPSLQIELITCLEGFEHFVNPNEEIERMLLIADNIFFTTSLLPNPIPKPESWWYYGVEHGQHISFYSEKTLSYIAKKMGLNCYTYGSFHLFTKKSIHPSVFKQVIKKSNIIFNFFVKNQKKSLTFNDMNYLIENGRK